MMEIKYIYMYLPETVVSGMTGWFGLLDSQFKPGRMESNENLYIFKTYKLLITVLEY